MKTRTSAHRIVPWMQCEAALDSDLENTHIDRPAAHEQPTWLPWTVALVMGTLTFMLRAIHLSRSWDIFVDEITYYRLSRSVADTLTITLYGKPFFLHPPLFFFLQGAYLKLIQPRDNLIADVYAARWINVLLASLTAALLFLLGRRLSGWAAGLIVSGYVMFDPFIVRLNSRNLLETCVLFWTVLGYYLLCRIRTSATNQQRAAIVGSGLAFGLAIATKDTAIFLTLVPLGMCLVLDCSLSRRVAVTVGAIACIPYLLYLSGILLAGQWGVYTVQKFHGLQRFVGVQQTTGFKQPGGPSFFQAVFANIPGLVPTYLMLAVGGICALLLLIKASSERRLIAVWALSAYAYITYCVALGTLEEQFFYYPVIPAALTVALAAVMLVEGISPRSRGWWAILSVLGSVAAVFLGLSGFIWAQFHFTPDNGYERLRQTLTATVPRGSRIAATSQTAEFLLYDYRSGAWATADALKQNEAQYVVVSLKDISNGYSRARPDLVPWLDAHGKRIFQFNGRSNGSLVLYKLEP